MATSHVEGRNRKPKSNNPLIMNRCYLRHSDPAVNVKSKICDFTLNA